MWIEERNGKYRFFERYNDPITGKTKRVSCTLDRNTAASRKKAAAILQRKIDDGCANAAVPQLITLQALIDRYAAHQAVTVKNSTADRNAYESKAIIRMLGGDVIVECLTVSHVMKKLTSSGETATNTNARIKYFRALIRWGYKSDLLPSPGLADKLEYLPDRRKKEKLRDKYMEPKELEDVLDAMNITRWKLLTEFLRLSGLRIGELIALDDADVGEKYIRVDKTYNISTGGLHDTPKTDTSTRDVYIQDELADCIKRMRAERKKTFLKIGGKSDLFFPGYDVGYLHYDAYRIYLKETTERVIGRPLTPHACCHTMTSIFAAQGASLDAISRRLGHSDSNITRDVYYHVTAEQRKRDEAQIDRIRVLTSG